MPLYFIVLVLMLGSPLYVIVNMWLDEFIIEMRHSVFIRGCINIELLMGIIYLTGQVFTI